MSLSLEWIECWINIDKGQNQKAFSVIVLLKTKQPNLECSVVLCPVLWSKEKQQHIA